MSSKPNFKNIDFDVMNKVDELARAKNVPEITFPDASAPKPSESNEVTTGADSDSKQAKLVKKPAAQSPTKRLAVELPAYLVRAIADKAHANDSTIRYVVTQALQKAGFRVAAEDLKEDGRRER